MDCRNIRGQCYEYTLEFGIGVLLLRYLSGHPDRITLRFIFNKEGKICIQDILFEGIYQRDMDAAMPIILDMTVALHTNNLLKPFERHIEIQKKQDLIKSFEDQIFREQENLDFAALRIKQSKETVQRIREELSALENEEAQS